MTNASVKNPFAVLSLFALAIAISLGAFAITAHAQDDGDYSQPIDYGSDYSQPVDYGSDYSQPIDYSGDYSQSLDCGCDYSQPIDYGSDYSQPIDYSDYSQPIDYGTDYSQPIDYTYNQACGCDYTYQDGVGYTNQSYASTPSYSQPAQTSFRAPSLPSAPISYSAPTYAQPQQQYVAPRPQIIQQQPIYQPVQQQQQQQQQPVIIQQPAAPAQPINITNTNNNNNTNNNTNPVTVTTIVPVSQTPVQYPVQYVYQQPTYQPPQYTQPNYPIYQQPNYPTYNNVTCSITASPSSVQSGQPSYLRFSSQGATSAWLSDGIGSVNPNGSLTVFPNGSQTYTLTVSGPGGTNTCTTYVTVSNSAPYVTLSQIPYTGFDFGMMGNMIYYLSLLSFAVAGGYLLVYYRGGMLTLATAAVGRAGSSVAAAPAKMVQATAKKIDQVMAPVLSPIQNVASASHLTTTDAMVLTHSKNGEAPRIVITRN